MGMADIVALIAALVNASREILGNVTQLSLLFQAMEKDGRTTLTKEEEATLVTLRDQARAALQSAINTAP